MNDTTTTEESLNFIKDYVGATNAANGSKYDANANVTNKNIATMSWEVPKKDNFLIKNRIYIGLLLFLCLTIDMN
jgi:ribonucleoside-triphosphate reductase (formate)